MREFEREGRVISYLDTGASGRGAGTIVLLHAFPLAAAMWEPQLAAAPRSWRVVAPDLAGFGRSFPPRPGATFEDDARDVVALLDHIGEEKVVVGGLSMGGYVAFALARVAAGRMRGLVLADTRAEADTEDARRSRLQMLDTLEAGGSAAVVESMLPRLLGETTRTARPEVVRMVREIGTRQSADGLRGAIHRLMGRPDSTSLLPLISCPTLVISGAEDAITGPDVARGMHERIRWSELSILERAGHVSNLEQPGPFNAVLVEFLLRRFDAS